MLRGRKYGKQKDLSHQNSKQIDPKKIESKAEGNPFLTQLVT